MHRLRRVLQRLRRRRMDPGVSRTGAAQPRLDPGQGRARCGKARAPARGRRRCRLPRLPHSHELHRALPDGPVSHRGDLGPQESSSGFGSEGRVVSAKAQSLLWIAQRASAALLALCVIVHLVTIIYAVQGGLSAAEIFGRTRGNVAWFIFYSIFVLGVAVHAPIGLRSVFIEWLAWRGRSRAVAGVPFVALLAWVGNGARFSGFAVTGIRLT